MSLLKDVLKSIRSLFKNEIKGLNESSEEFFKRIFDVEDVDIRRELHVYDYENIVSKDATYVNIKSQITQNDLNRIVRERRKLKTLVFREIDINGLDLSVLTQLEQISSIKFLGTKFNKNCLKSISPTVDVDFRKIDFNENPVRLSNHNVKITECSNISKIENLNKATKDLYIAESKIDDMSFDFPELETLDIDCCGKIENLEEIARKCPKLKALMLSGEPIKTLYFENKEGIVFENLEYLKISDSKEFTELGNVEGMFPKVSELDCSGTNLSSIENIARVFPKLDIIDFEEDRALTDIKPLLDYKREFNRVDLSSTGIDEDMEHVVKAIGTRVITSDSQMEKTKKKKLAKQVIIPKKATQYNGIKKLFFWEIPSNLDKVKITQLDLSRGIYQPATVSPQDLHHLQEFPEIAEMITKMRITIPEQFGMTQEMAEQEANEKESFAQIVKDIDALKKPKKDGRVVAFEITKIPELSKEDEKILSARFGLNFVYKVPISRGYSDYHCKNRNYIKNIYSDELVDIRKMLNELLEGKHDEVTELEKTNTVFSIMQDNFTLIQEKFGKDLFLMEEDSGVVKNTEETLRNNDILNALKTKKVTPQSYICIANELLKTLGISKMQNEIKVDNGLTEPEVRVPISDDEYVVINGKKGIEKKKERLPKDDERTFVYYEKDLR